METVQLEQIANNLIAKLEPACVEVLKQGVNFVATEALYSVIISIVFFMSCLKNEEIFYFVDVLGGIQGVTFDERCTLHYLLCKLGKCYKTYKEAKKHVEEDVKFYKNM